MSLAQSIRPLIPLVIGLAVGGAGAILFQQSMPGAAGSPEERAAQLEVKLKKAENRIASLEAADPSRARRKPGHTLKDSLSALEEDLLAGRPVTPDDIFHAGQPVMRALSPLFDRMRVRGQKQMIEQMSGELSRKYNLTATQQDALKQWFQAKSEEDAKKWSALVAQDGTRLEDVMKASRDVRPDEGLDQFMEKTLSGEKLTAFKTERMAARSERVQQYADAQTQRLDSIVKLDDSQRDQVFGIMAQSSHDYDPAMKLEGAAGAINATPAGDKQAAILSVLKPDQRTAYEAERQHRREEAQKDMEALGLTLPPGWDPLNADGF